MFDSIQDIKTRLADHDYVADDGLCTSLFLSLRMGKALFLEGEPGVGKTEVAKVLSRALDTPLIRLQCYEGLDLQPGGLRVELPRQLLEIQARQGGERPGTSPRTSSARSSCSSDRCSGDRPEPRAGAGAADRRARPGRRGVRELPARAAVGLPGDDPEIGTLEAEHKPITSSPRTAPARSTTR